MESDEEGSCILCYPIYMLMMLVVSCLLIMLVVLFGEQLINLISYAAVIFLPDILLMVIMLLRLTFKVFCKTR